MTKDHIQHEAGREQIYPAGIDHQIVDTDRPPRHAAKNRPESRHACTNQVHESDGGCAQRGRHYIERGGRLISADKPGEETESDTGKACRV